MDPSPLPAAHQKLLEEIYQMNPMPKNKYKEEPKGSKRKAAKILRDAAVLIETTGWCQRSFSRDGAHCLVGAVHGASVGTTYSVSIGKSVSLEDLRRSLPHKQLALRALRTALKNAPVGYNDATDTTKTDVLRALRTTARALEHGMVVGINGDPFS